MNQALPRIVMLGRSGAGKGTQGKYLSERLGIPHISSGDILRHIAAIDSPLGQRIATQLNAGHYASDGDMDAAFFVRLSQPDCQSGWVLDGYPRRDTQAETLDQFSPPAVAILLELSDTLATERLTKRWLCPNGHIINEDLHRSRTELHICPYCDEPLSQRQDDVSMEKIQERLGEYHGHAPAVNDYYDLSGRLLPVAGSMPIPAIRKYLLSRPVIMKFFNAMIG